MNSDSLVAHVREILSAIGEDPDREGLLKTPDRVARALRFLTKGYEEDPKSVINGALFSEDYQEMIVLKDLDYFSMCEHHMLPFFGKAHVAYIPSTKIVGISKLARLVEIYARRLQIQEKMTAQIADALQEVLKPRGVAVVVEAAHQCMTTRGVHKPGVSMVTSRMVGAFRSDARTRREFLSIIDMTGQRGLPNA